MAEFCSEQRKLLLDHVRLDERNPVLAHFGVTNVTKVSTIIPVQVPTPHFKVAGRVKLKAWKHAIIVPIGVDQARKTERTVAGSVFDPKRKGVQMHVTL